MKKDKFGRTLKAGCIVKHDHGYYLLVCQDENNKFYGSLLSNIGHICRNIRYALTKSQIEYMGVTIPSVMAKDNKQ